MLDCKIELDNKHCGQPRKERFKYNGSLLYFAHVTMVTRHEHNIYYDN